MAKYGIPYQGSKSSIADNMIQVLPKGKRFVDLFGGGFAMSECALRSGKYEQVLYNEINPLLPQLIKKAISGSYNYNVFKPEWISRERFHDLKDKDGYIKYIWSFSNDGRTYLFGENIEQKKKSLHNYVVYGIKDEYIKAQFNDIDKYVNGEDIRKRRILLGRYMKAKQAQRPLKELEQLEQLEQLERLQRLQRLEQLERLQQLQQLEQLEGMELKCGDYKEYIYRDGDVVYCDPPYEATTGYGNLFNTNEFYEWVYTRPYQIYFSSYQISDKRFKMIWARGKVNLKSGAKYQKQNYECLYTNK